MTLVQVFGNVEIFKYIIWIILFFPYHWLNDCKGRTENFGIILGMLSIVAISDGHYIVGTIGLLVVKFWHWCETYDKDRSL